MKLLSASSSTKHKIPPTRDPAAADSPADAEVQFAEPAATTAGEENQPEAVKRRRHILVADDDAKVRDALARLFRRAGYRVSSAKDGETAWESLCAHKFDALVTDHLMPRLTGLDLLRRIRAGTLNALPVVLISGQMPWEETDLLDLVWPGTAMEKPFTFFELLTNVRTVLPLGNRSASTLAGNISPLFEESRQPASITVGLDDGRTRLPLRRSARGR